MIEKSRVTLHDVASLAGVSHQTVSRVINKTGHVRPETKARVKAAILELGYRPNAIARSMVRGSTHTLGCISPNLTDPVLARIIESAQAEARRRGFFILIGSAGEADEVKPLLDELLNRQVDGLMVLNARDDSRYLLLEPLAEKGSPIVYVKNSAPDGRISSVHCDDIQGGYLATRHLLELGHRRIALILGLENEQCTRERLAGYQTALREAGLEPEEQLIRKGDWTADGGKNAAGELLQSGIPFSALFAQNDRMAAGAIQALRQAGRPVPGDVSVIGYDNGPLARLTDPPLTTMEQPLEYFGRQAAAILIDNILNGTNSPVEVCQEPTLVLRDSTQPFSSNPSD